MLEMKYTTDTAMSASYLNIHLEINNRARFKNITRKEIFSMFPL